MPWQRPRQQLLACALLDVVGFVPAATIVDALRPGALLSLQVFDVLKCASLYLLLGWLLGSYTVLRWPGLGLSLVLKRLLLTAIATGLAMVLLGWLLNASETVTVLHRGTLVLLLSLEMLWGLGIRVGLRLVGAVPGRPSPLLLLASPKQGRLIAQEWVRTPQPNAPRLLSPGLLRSELMGPRDMGQLAVAPELELEPEQQRQLEQLEQRGVTLSSLEQMVEERLERLPPALLPQEWLDYAQLRWSNEFSFQRKLKRVADVAVAGLLLLLSSPLLLLAALGIWLEDRGPVLYVQERSGWMGQPFRVLKLRTMRQQRHEGPASWTVPGDQRITRVGRLLRPSRLDELPQLLNVIRGEMSLIGPRPERPELEHEMERSIPHYRKRHWMPPGLSGWAQVCAPYAASIEEAELKLSYDLYYLRHWSTALDLLILAKTIKTVLKGAGR